MKPVKLKFEDEKIHELFKIKCIQDGSNMQEQLMKMVLAYLKDGEK